MTDKYLGHELCHKPAKLMTAERFTEIKAAYTAAHSVKYVYDANDRAGLPPRFIEVCMPYDVKDLIEGIERLQAENKELKKSLIQATVEDIAYIMMKTQLAEAWEKIHELCDFVAPITLILQDSGQHKRDILFSWFHRAYKLYAKYDVENRHKPDWLKDQEEQKS